MGEDDEEEEDEFEEGEEEDDDDSACVIKGEDLIVSWKTNTLINSCH